jgi:phosphoserine phosphatase RsbU/P
VRVLIAEDDPVSRRILERLLRKWGYDVLVTTDGDEAWVALQSAAAPDLAVLDIMMPKMDGIEICRRLRAINRRTYIILVTAKHGAREIVKGIEAGADDYLTKPYDPDEMRVRVLVGARIVDLQSALAGRVVELERALAEVKQLHGILPICSYCRKIRDDSDYWQTVEQYLATHSEAKFSHGICPSCYETTVKPQLDLMRVPAG